MNIQNLNFDPSPYGLFYGMTAVCMLLLFGMWRLYLRNESLEEYGQLTDDFDKSAIAASTELMAKINSQIVEINYLNREIANERKERIQLGFEISRLQDELKSAEDANKIQAKGYQSILNKYNKLRKEFKELHDLHHEVLNIATERENKPTESKTDAPIDYSTWSDEELLKKAYSDYGLGVKFKSILVHRDKNSIREVKPCKDGGEITFDITMIDTIRCVWSKSGLWDNSGEVCSNPYLYKDGEGWCPIIKDEAAPEYYDTIKEIKPGDRFMCVEDVIMSWGDGRRYTSGKIYNSEIYGCITNDAGRKNHIWTIDAVSEYFKKLKI